MKLNRLKADFQINTTSSRNPGIFIFQYPLQKNLTSCYSSILVLLKAAGGGREGKWGALRKS